MILPLPSAPRQLSQRLPKYFQRRALFKSPKYHLPGRGSCPAELVRFTHQNIRINDIGRPKTALSPLVEKCADIVNPVQAEQTHLIVSRLPSLKSQNIMVPEDGQILIHLDLKTKVGSLGQILEHDAHVS